MHGPLDDLVRRQDQYRRVRDGRLAAGPQALTTDRIRDVLSDYDSACRTSDKEYV